MSDHIPAAASPSHSGASWGIVSLVAAVAVTLVCGIGYAAYFSQTPAPHDDKMQQAIAMRLQKIGSVNLVPPAAEASAAGGEVSVGEALYKKSCSACHGSGAAGAPKFGNKDDWAPRIAQGMDTLLKVAINGKGGMPPRGASTASDDDLKAAVEYMVENAK